jgi:DNA-binding PadR family transcriptional regulator
VSVGLSLLAILVEAPAYGLELKAEFEKRTGGVWPLNAGQVYTTLDRLERDGLVRQSATGPDGQKIYEPTAAGRERLEAWFANPAELKAPPRDELVLKLVMALSSPGISVEEVIQSERKATLQLLQEYTRLKRDASPETDLGWLFLLDSLIYQAEARVRWLDTCESRIERSGRRPKPEAAHAAAKRRKSEVRS